MLIKIRIALFLATLACFFSVGPAIVIQGNGATPEATKSPVADKVGAEMVYVPSGIVEMGITRDEASSFCDNKPDCVNVIEKTGVLETYKVELPAFWIDKYEVTLDQFKAFQEFCLQYSTCEKYDLSDVPQLTDNPQKPQIGVSWYDAMRFCNYRGARLPTEQEWEYAASGPQGFIYPWGDEFIPANIALGSTWPVGSKPGNVSWVGAYDMAGNVAEWTENNYRPYSPSTKDWPQGDLVEISRVVRGGSWADGGLSLTTFDRSYRRPDEHGRTIGFRCVRSGDPEN